MIEHDPFTDELFAKGLVYGPQGQGKTHFLGSCTLDERLTPFYLLDFEGGSLTLRGLPGRGETWEYKRVRDWDDYNDAYETLLNNKEGYKGCGLDSLSETHIFALLDILRVEGTKRKVNDLIQLDDYGRAMVQLRRLVRHFRDLPMHVFFTATAKDHTDPKEGLIKKVALSGQMSDDVVGMMDFTGYLAITEDEEGETIRSLLLQNYPKIRTKVRTPWGVTVPDEIDDPTATKLLDALGY